MYGTEYMRHLSKCQHDYQMNKYCGTTVCTKCDDHHGLARCYCGWSKTRPGEGRQELIEMGETIDPEDA